MIIRDNYNVTSDSFAYYDTNGTLQICEKRSRHGLPVDCSVVVGYVIHGKERLEELADNIDHP